MSIEEEFESFMLEHCVRKEFLDLPIALLCTTMDRQDLGKLLPSGPHEAEMAMWSEPFSGGLALGRYILNRPDQFKGRRVVDVGTGSGIVAIAAIKAGAEVVAIDSSPFSVRATRLNGLLNGIVIEAIEGNICDKKFYRNAEVILAGDVFHKNADFHRLPMILARQAANGKTVYAASQDEDLSTLMAAEDVKVETLAKRGGTSMSIVKLTPRNPRAKTAHLD